MKLGKAQRILLSSSLSVFLTGCGAPNYSQGEMHLTLEEADSQQQVKPEKRPGLVKSSPTAPVLSNARGSDTFDIVVTNVPVRDLLFALARDAGINMDIDDKIGGLVTINALDQTLDAILERIGEQVDIRVETVGDALVIKPDRPYYKHYYIDFLNVNRTYSSSATTAGVGDGGTSSISNAAANSFWDGLGSSLDLILSASPYLEGEGVAGVLGVGEDAGSSVDLVASAESEGEAAPTNSFDLNQETGVLIVYAPERLQREVQALLDASLAIAKRQVLLEATVVEVVLNNQYAQGIDWSLFSSLADEGLALYQGGAVGGAAAAVEYLTRALTSEATLPFIVSGAGPATDKVPSQTELNEQYAAAVAAAEAAQSNFGAGLNSLTSFEYDIEPIEETVSVQTEGVGTTPTTDDVYEDQEVIVGYQLNYDAEYEQINEEATRARSGGLKPRNLDPGSFFTAAYREGDISAAVQLLDQFGEARVLSSPRISALNHQPALLRVVDEEVYFSFEVEEDINEETGVATSREYTVTEETVGVGFAMNVLPHVSENGEIILNLKPSVSRVLDYRRAPIPSSFGTAAGGPVENFVPILRTREIESMISLQDGEIAVLGGLLEDRTGDDSSGVPGLSGLPGVGALFEKKNQSTYKTEFVVFLRARIIKNPSINADYSDYRVFLPKSDFIIRGTGDTLLPPDQKPAR